MADHRTAAAASPQPRRMSVALVMNSLGPGGAQRIGASLVNHWVEQGWTVTLLLFSDPEERLYFPLDERARVCCLGIEKATRNLASALWNNLGRLSTLRSAIRETGAQVVVSFEDKVNVLTLLATRGLDLPVIASERSNPRDHDVGRIWRWLRRCTYRYASCVTVQTERASSYLAVSIRVAAKVIPNQIEPLPFRRRQTAEGRRVLTAVGRLGPEKGFDLLLPAFAAVAPQHPEWSLVIWGEGQEREKLERLRNDLKLTDRVSLPGITARHGQWVERADIFVLSSRYEGFPNVLGEAMAAGLPVVAADCPSGPREMVLDRVNGLLVPSGDVTALARSLDELMTDEALRNRLGRAAQEAAREFSSDRIMPLWSALISRAARRGHGID